MAASDQLWWTSHGAVHALLQNAGISSQDLVCKQLEGHFDWLLNGLQNFKQPNEDSRKLLDQKSILLRGKKFGIEPRFKTATLKLSTLLVCIIRCARINGIYNLP